MTSYVIHAKLAGVEQKTRVARAWKDKTKDEIHVERESLGWFILLEGSSEWLRVGDEEPDLSPGQSITLRIDPT